MSDYNITTTTLDGLKAAEAVLERLRDRAKELDLDGRRLGYWWVPFAQLQEAIECELLMCRSEMGKGAGP